MTSSHAHALSLPLYSLLQKLDGHPSWEASLDIRKALEVLHLEKDLDPVIVITSHCTAINVESKTPTGHAVLEELRARSQFLPCPEGECEYASSGNCLWCGGPKK